MDSSLGPRDLCIVGKAVATSQRMFRIVGETLVAGSGLGFTALP